MSELYMIPAHMSIHLPSGACYLRVIQFCTVAQVISCWVAVSDCSGALILGILLAAQLFSRMGTSSIYGISLCQVAVV